VEGFYMKKYYGFLLLGLISFVLLIWKIANITEFGYYRIELIFIEIMILFSIVVAFKLYSRAKEGIFFAIVFFTLMSANSLYVFYKAFTFLSAIMLLWNLYGIVYFQKTKIKIRKKRRVLQKRRDYIDKQIGNIEEPKVIIEKKRYVAGKRGKYYYIEDHRNAKRITKKRHVVPHQRREEKAAILCSQGSRVQKDF
jgi:predicted membrane protein